MSGVTGDLKLNQRLKGFQRLKNPFEADGPRRDLVFRRSLSHDRAGEVIGLDMSPNLLSHQLGSLAAQVARLHRRLHRTQIEFVVPTRSTQRRQLLLGRLLRVQQGGHVGRAVSSRCRRTMMPIHPLLCVRARQSARCDAFRVPSASFKKSSSVRSHRYRSMRLNALRDVPFRAPAVNPEARKGARSGLVASVALVRR